MDDNENDSRPQNGIDREKTSPFLIRAFVKIGGFHRTQLFEENSYPTVDEHQIFTWRDSTLKEVLTCLREVSSNTTEIRHPLARCGFKALYADGMAKGAFTTKDLGMVYSRDILGEPGTVVSNSADDGTPLEPTAEEEEKRREEKTLEDLRFMPGDFLLVSVMLPKMATGVGATGGTTTAGIGGFSIKGSGGLANGLGGGAKWATGGARGGDGGWGGGAAPPTAPPGGLGRGGGHWRARPAAIAHPPGRGGGGGGGGAPAGGRGERDIDRERERDRDKEPYGRRSPPPYRGGRGGRGGGGRDGGRFRDRGRDRDGDRDRNRDRRSRSRTRSRSPPPPRRSRSRSRSRTRSRSRSPLPPRRRRYD